MIRFLFIFLLTQFILISVEAQKLPSRISPSLQARPAAYFEDQWTRKDFIIEMRPGAEVPPFSGVPIKGAGKNIFILTATPAQIWKLMNSDLPFLYVDEQLKPVAESGVLSYDMTANRVNAVWSEFSQLRGEGQVVSVKENRMDTNDIDLLKRYVTSPLISPVIETHATAMTTLIAGAGNSFYTGKGVASKARYSSSDFITVLPDTAIYYRSLGIDIQNHSYGTGLQNFYGINARAFDLSVQDNPSLLHVFSAGNSGSQTPGLGMYAGLRGFANITGNMKMAKNILLAGAMDSAGQIPLLSSKGPLYDGRIAPHVVAFGEDGTSGAAAIISGVALLLQQQYKQQYNATAPSSLIRAILVNSADDTNAPGPDFFSGFGKLNAVMALRTLKENRFLNDEIPASAFKEHRITLPPGTAAFKVSLAWNDPAVAAGSEKALLNDLDLELLTPSGAALFPWTLNSYPAADSLLQPAVRRRDTLNNIEQVSITDPAAGEYIIRVRSGVLRTARQPYAIAFQPVAKDLFSWTFPSGDEASLQGNELFVRWMASYAPGTLGLLELRRNQGPWELLSNTVDLARGYFAFKPGDSLHQLSFRMTMGSTPFTSGNIFVAPALIDKYGYVCDTTILHYWSRVPGASGYRLFRLAEDTMQALLTTTDTTAITRKAGGVYFAVSPMYQGKTTLRGNASNYTRQGVGCFIDNFLVDLQPDNTGLVTLTLGSLFKIRKVEIVKVSANGKLLLKAEPPTGRTITYTDRALDQGMNTYQALVYLDDGSVIASDKLSIYYLNNTSHLLFPNPAVRGQDIFVVSDLPTGQLAIIYDNQGRQLMTAKLEDRLQAIHTYTLPAGLYHMRIMEGTKLVRKFSFVIR